MDPTKLSYLGPFSLSFYQWGGQPRKRGTIRGQLQLCWVHFSSSRDTIRSINYNLRIVKRLNNLKSCKKFKQSVWYFIKIFFKSQHPLYPLYHRANTVEKIKIPKSSSNLAISLNQLKWQHRNLTPVLPLETQNSVNRVFYQIKIK